MNLTRKLFILGFIVFIAALLYASYDIATRTTFPGSKPQLKERIKDKLNLKDTSQRDSVIKKP
ncbi:MAG: hypothetical protein HRU69_11235 [Flammeovirgaceae bacterium]|nr:MAG: hypothetical protein HRU69_11235 [Flammeovirgaceae bacterium]